MLRSALVAALLVLLPVNPVAAAAASAELVAFNDALPPGTIVVHTAERRLYLVLRHGKAMRYTIGVGRQGRQWTGGTVIEGKYVRPNWKPPTTIRNDRPGLPTLIRGGDANNPMGAAALTLAGGEYAIHGTNSPDSIGGFVSYGCIRMYNADIMDLYGRVRIGTPVLVMP